MTPQLPCHASAMASVPCVRDRPRVLLRSIGEVSHGVRANDRVLRNSGRARRTHGSPRNTSSAASLTLSRNSQLLRLRSADLSRKFVMSHHFANDSVTSSPSSTAGALRAGLPPWARMSTRHPMDHRTLVDSDGLPPAIPMPFVRHQRAGTLTGPMWHPPPPPSDVLERPYTVGAGGYRQQPDRMSHRGGGGGIPPLDPPPPPPPLPMFEADSQNFALTPRGFKLKILWPAFAGDHRGTRGGGGSQPNNPPPFQTPPPPLCTGPPGLTGGRTHWALRRAHRQ